MQCFFVLILFFSLPSYSQVTFQKTYGGVGEDNAFALDTTRDKGCIIGGYTTSNAVAGKDALVIKVDSLGTLEWSKSFDIENGDDYITDIHQVDDGGYIMCGVSMVDYHFFLVKMNAFGVIQWTRIQDEYMAFLGFKVHQTADHGFITSFTGGPGNANTYNLEKFNFHGDLLWQRAFEMGNNANGGYGVAELPGGDIISCGNMSSVYPASTYDSIVVLRSQPLGNLVWVKKIGVHGFVNGINGCFDVQYLPTGNLLLTCYSWSNISFWELVIIEISSDGALIWANNYGIQMNYFYSTAVKRTKDQCYVSAISDQQPVTSSDMMLVKVGNTGDFIWGKRFGGIDKDVANAVAVCRDGGIFLVGYTYSFGAGNKDVYLVKTDSLGHAGCNETPITLQYGKWKGVVSSVNYVSEIPDTVSNAFLSANPASPLENLVCTSLAVEPTNFDKDLKVYPNPASNSLSLDFGNLINHGLIKVYNSQGQLVFLEKLTMKDRISLDISNYPSGLYQINLMGDQAQQVRKFVVVK